MLLEPGESRSESEHASFRAFGRPPPAGSSASTGRGGAGAQPPATNDACRPVRRVATHSPDAAGRRTAPPLPPLDPGCSFVFFLFWTRARWKSRIGETVEEKPEQTGTETLQHFGASTCHGDPASDGHGLGSNRHVAYTHPSSPGQHPSTWRL